MNGLTFNENYKVSLTTVPKPEKAAPGHLLVKMCFSTIQHGDQAFLRGGFKKGRVPTSKYNLLGGSGAGTVIDVGEGLPKDKYLGKSVSVYRSLKFGDNLIGTWSEIGQYHPHQCILLQNDIQTDRLDEYSGTLVNAITAYAFVELVKEKGHSGIVVTAGNTGTGRCMLGVCLEKNIPLISIVRSEKGKKELEILGAKHVLVLEDSEFEAKLEKLAGDLGTNAVFDGVGGKTLSRVITKLPINSTVYVYGFLGARDPMSLYTINVLMRGLTITGFGNYRSKTVTDIKRLEAALEDMAGFIHKECFKVKVGKCFKFEEFEDAIKYHGPGKGVFKI